MFGGVMSASLAASGANTLIVEERSEARLRATDPASAVIGASPAFDFVTTPSLRLQVTQRRWDWTLGAAYTFTAADIGQPGAQQLTNFGVGTMGFGWHNRHVMIRLQEDGSYGQANFSFLAPTTLIPPATGPAARPPTLTTALTRFTTRTVDYYNSQSSLAVTAQVDRRWFLSLTVGYLNSGGANFQSRNVSEGGLASQRTPYALGLLTYRFDSRNDGILSLGGRHNDTSVVADFALPTAGISPDPARFAGITQPIPLAFEGLSTDEGDAALTWRRTWSRQVDSVLEGGASLIRQRFPDTGWRPVPTGEAVLSEKFGRSVLKGTSTQGVYLLPAFDFITGSVVVPFTATITTTLTERKQRTYAADAGVTRTTSLFRSSPITTVNGGANAVAFQGSVAPQYTTVQGSASVTQALSKRFDVSGGVHVAWERTDSQQIPGQGVQQAQSVVATVVFAAFVYHEPPIHF